MCLQDVSEQLEMLGPLVLLKTSLYGYKIHIHLKSNTYIPAGGISRIQIGRSSVTTNCSFFLVISTSAVFIFSYLLLKCCQPLLAAEVKKSLSAICTLLLHLDFQQCTNEH